MIAIILVVCAIVGYILSRPVVATARNLGFDC